MTLLVLISPNSAASINNKNKQKICNANVCKANAKTVLSYMKKNVDPCKDFYQFACGGLLENGVIPADKSGIDEFYITSDKVKEELRTILTEERPSTDPKHFQLPNRYYKACMNTELIEKLGVKPVKDLTDSLGGWPLVKGEAWDPQNNWTWISAMQAHRDKGLIFDYIIYFGIDTGYEDNTKRMLYVYDSEIGLERGYLLKGLKNKFVSAYYNLSVDVAVLLGANEEVAKKEMLEALQFETALANLSFSGEEKSDADNLNNVVTIKEMQKKWPYMNWLEYINSLLGPQVQVDENEVVNVASDRFMDNIGALLEKTPKRTIANYIMWRIHYDAITMMPKVFYDKYREFQNLYTGVKEQQPHWLRCVKEVNSYMDISVGSLYVQKYFTNKTKEAATAMVNNIGAVFKEMLQTEDWMDKKTKKEALKKLKEMQAVVGYPIELIDNEKLAEYYRGLEINEDEFYYSFLNMNKVNWDRDVRELRLPADKKDWRLQASATKVDAFYDRTVNRMQIPAAVIQGSFFNAERPQYMNYGSLGWLIGHEITHGYDNQGSQYDYDGNLKDWWQNSTRQAYLEKTSCIVDQYSSRTETDTKMKVIKNFISNFSHSNIFSIQVDGDLTQAENIADNGGIIASYEAYKKWAKKNGPEPQLPGLGYTPEQMFWISAGQLWCTKVTKEYMRSLMETDPHAPSEFRINVSFANRKEFAKDFKCAAGSPMNPKKKCQVW